MSTTSKVLNRIVAALILFFSWFNYSEGDLFSAFSLLVLAVFSGAMTFEKGTEKKREL